MFVEQQEGRVSVREHTCESMRYRRSIVIDGLKNATVRFFAENYCKDT